MLYAVVFGLILPLVARMNDQLSRHVGQLAGAWGPHIAGAVFGALCLLPFAGREWPSRLGNVPWWGFLGGVVGSGLVILANLSLQRLPTGTFVAVTLAAQIVSSALMDHYGVAGSPVHPMTLQRALGFTVLFTGAVLVVRT